MNLQIKGTGRALPRRVVTNEDLTSLVDTSDEWIRDRTGIVTRHISTGETVTDLAAEACSIALKKAGQSPEAVDLIIVATCSAELGLPGCACQVQERIGARNAVAFDLNAACAGFLFALNTAYAYFAGGIYNNALIVGAEVLSKLVDWEDRSTCVLFGDGAGAAYVEAAPGQPRNYWFVQHADGRKWDALVCGQRDVVNPFAHVPVEEHTIHMKGKEIFSFALRQIPACIHEALAEARLKPEEVDIFLLHQANKRILQGIAARLGQPVERFPVNVDHVGNMSAAAIPVLLDECMEDGRVTKGQRMVLSGFGAGLTYGAAVLLL